MVNARLTLAHSVLALGALFSFACSSSHGTDDGGSADASTADSDTDSGLMDSGVDSGLMDSGVRMLCDPEDARIEICPDALCDGLSSWHWDGERCVEFDCGVCRGTDCDAGVWSLVECEAAHAGCESALCRDSGGTWAWWLPVCGPYQCGVAPPEDCEVASPACDCGAFGHFVDGVGCQPDSTCPALPAPAEALCTSTGGTRDASCCHTECGIPCAAACAAPACDCGSTGIFDLDRGCIVGQRCMERVLGDSCVGGARCDDGTICCDSCGGAGCAGNPTCRIPVCSDDPAIDSCGNNSLAP